MGLVPQPVAVGRSAAVAVPLPRVLFLSTSDFPSQLLDLELIERLEHVSDQPPLGARLIAGRQRIEDLDAGPRHLPLVGQRMDRSRLSREVP